MLEATCGGNFRFISSTPLWKHGRKASLINKDEGLACQFQEVPRPYILELKEGRKEDITQNNLPHNKTHYFPHYFDIRFNNQC